MASGAPHFLFSISMTEHPVSSSGSDSLEQDLTERTLGNYVLIRRLGRGGMANVYLAHQTTLDRPVAIKVLKPELAGDRAYVARFHREAQAAAALVQANIVQIYEVGEIDGIHFIAQEYVRGQNLRQYLNRHTVVEPILAVSIMSQVAAALQRASEHHVIHRDIKPENIMIASTGEVKVTDFGLARVMDDSRADLTQIGITMGTPLYMSPEQAEGGHVDTRSDLYSLGITAWHMLAGRPPFEGENALAIAVKHLKETLPDLSRIRPDLPPALCDIIHKLASKKPEDRFQTPAQLTRQIKVLEFDDIADWDLLTEKLDVEDLSAGIGATTVQQTRLDVTRQLETIMSGQFRPWWRSPALALSVIVFAALGLLAGALVAYNNPPPDPLAVDVTASGKIPKMESARSQYYYAYNTAANPDTSPDDEVDLWLSVKRYFPEYDESGIVDEMSVLYSRKTDVRLGEYYLEVGDYESALRYFDALADLAETEEEFRMTGLAGQAIVYDHVKEEDSLKPLLLILQDKGTEKLLSDYLNQKVQEMLARRFPGQLRM